MSEMQSLSADRYFKYLDHAQTALQATLDQYSEYKAEYHELQQTLLDLPQQVEHDAMIPLGPLAFYPGKLIHTNEILVMLGDNWFVEQSAWQAQQIAARRESLVDAKLDELTSKLADLKQRRSLTEKLHVGGELGGDVLNEDGEPIMDIKEQLDDAPLPDADVTCHEQPREMLDKRQRLIDELHKEADTSVLDPETRAILERLEQIGSDDSSGSESSEESDDGDAFSDEDRLNAARDDDEDDYNADAHLPPLTSATRAAPKSILKPSRPPQSLFKSRRQTTERVKSVSFGEADAGPGEEQDVDDMAVRFSELDMAVQAKPAKPATPRFKPNLGAAGVRSPAGTTPKPTEPAAQPLRAQVVERQASADVPDIDEDLHAREISLKYHQMRRARLASGMLAGAADIAEQVLAATPGVTLVDAPGRAQEDERIELSGDSTKDICQEVPEVIATSRDTNPPATKAPRMSRFKAQRLQKN
ncbi:hypothetical protein EV183_005322 [Coemansia sp. RSA 2336]|nr:hypothetical protein EV183_005322 [Coemansia sp. RSA 2336]